MPLTVGKGCGRARDSRCTASRGEALTLVPWVDGRREGQGAEAGSEGFMLSTEDSGYGERHLHGYAA